MKLPHRMPRLLQPLLPGICRRPSPSSAGEMAPDPHTLYLTFDDGPVPGVTDYILELLAKSAAQATFFAVGDNVRKCPELAREVVAAGHGLENHTFHHLKAWSTPKGRYLSDLEQTRALIYAETGYACRFFRPPYGQIPLRSLPAIQQNYELVFWDVLSGDIDPRQTDAEVLHACVRYMRPGSVLLFHDQEKTKTRLRRVLPDLLRHITDAGYTLKCL
ncbi:polysaccharide deacetylase [Nitritalea halalkaliphila LW7]|uniref:Polysaccharide deacetylase n=1 Tax=Nitritalea halalkaliphila LW7 TaxID=1189621 RepID=I5C1P7_9BACT|nr:polysaccharide deacetylase family protein [Nitritalea halalkaliphila]EIM75749.1 polysaccharide deacetylase [Nitritalea halalkaliphila LW7]